MTGPLSEGRDDPRPRVFPLVLHATYYNRGFFNVTVEFDRFVRRTEGAVPILLGTERLRIEGRVDRTANRNGTARVIGGGALRDWFRNRCREGQTVYVNLASPAGMSITVEPPATDSSAS